MWFGGLFLIWTAALPTIVFLFPAQPLLQLGYTSAFTIIAIGNLPSSLFSDLHIETSSGRFSLHFLSVVLLSLMPTIHALAEPVHTPSPLATAFGQMVISILFGGAFYLLRPLERIGRAGGWQPSLHVMHLVLTYSLVAYSKAVLQAAVTHMS